VKLRARLALTAMAVIVPTLLGLVLFDAIARHRAAESLLAELVSARLPNERGQCEADPAGWGGTLGGHPDDRPPGKSPPRERKAEGGAPHDRPPHDGPPHDGPPHDGARPRPAEVFAYDELLQPHSSDAPPISAALAREIIDHDRAIEPFAWRTDDVVVLLRTPWNAGPCAFVLARGSTGDWGAVLPESWLWALPTLAVVSALLLAIGPVIGRLQRLTAAVSRSAANDYREPIASDDRDEIGDLARAFDAAGAEVREQLAARAQREQALREFLANTTHDVMIPLTVLQGHLAGLRDRLADGVAIAPGLVSSAMDEAHYIASLLQNLAAAARLDAADGELHRGAVELGELVARVVARHRPIAIERGIAIEHAVPEQPVRTHADLTLLEQAVGNLVHNAVRYNQRGGHVAVVLERGDARFSLRVIDDGPGIAADQLAGLLARGARGDDARTRAPEGQGIGLHIARRVVALHGFELALVRSEYGGLEARLEGDALGDA
jgi:two-component system, OmpR family, sensor histidine kinase BaeS